MQKKVKMQKIVYPDGISYDIEKHAYLTKRINSIILCTEHLAQVSDKKKALNFALVKQNSARVEFKVGLPNLLSDIQLVRNLQNLF
jgi:hypothetical protein